MDDGFTLWESLTEQPALRATASEDEPVILSYSVHYDFPTVTVEPYFTTNTYGESVFVRSFYLNGPAAVEVKGSKVKKNGEPANTNQILTGVKIPANVQAAFEQMKADPSASFTKTAADVGDEFPCPWCSMPLTEDDLVGDDQCPYCHAALDFDGSTGVGQWVMRKGASYAGQGVIGWGFVEKYEDRSVKSHLIIRHADGDYDTACHHKVDCNALTLSNDTPPSWDRCQACQRILDGGAEVPSPFGHITAASRVGQAYLGGTITSIEDDAVIVTYANGEVAKVSKVSWEWNKTGSKVAWDESQHKRQDKGTSDPSGKYRPGQFVPKDSTEVADQGDDTSIFDGGDPGTPAPSTPAEGDEAVLEGDPAQSPSAEDPGVQENGVESPEPEVEDQPDLSMFDIGDDGVMKPPSRHAPVDMAAKNAFAALPTATRDALADPANTVPARVQEIVAPRSESYPDDLREAVDQRMDEIKGVMPPKIAQMARQHMQHLGTLLQAANPQADPAAVQDLMLDACDYLVAQDAEAQGRTLGDHGARHLLTDARVASEVVKLAGDGSPATEAMMYLCGIFHDTGYMAPPARQFLDSDHPRWSRQNYKANVEPKVNAVLGPEVAKEAAKIIVSHDRTEMNWDEGERAASAFRLADNLGLFHADKLPGFCFLVPQNIGIMVQLAEGRLDVEAARTELKANINKAELTGQVKSHLYDAVDEVGAMLPKFMLGMVGTKLGGIEWAGDHPIVHLQRTEANEALSKVLDMGQRQFLKFAETYMGEDEAPKFLENEHFEFKNRRGNLVLESRLNNPMTKDEIKAVAVSIRVRGGWLFDKITQPVYDYAKDRFGTEPSFDWCRFRHDSHCFFPKDLDVQATEQAGYDVWIPIDRGYCPRIKWKQQQECPIGEPGPNSHEPGAGLETWQSYGDGGQRGYASLHTEAASDIVITPRDYLDPMDWPEGYPIERRYSDLSKVYEARNAEGKVMGYARLRQRDIDGVWFVWRIETYPEFQRQGVATAIIEQARADLGRVDHSPERERTADGMAWSKAVGSKAASLKEMMASFEFQATWADVNSKAKRIRESGGVNIISVTDDTITAEVKGDSDTYLTSIQRVPGTKQIALWECFLPDAPVMMADGSERPISEIRPGDEVISHEGRVCRVARAEPKPYSGNIVRVSFRGDHRDLVATAGHEVWSANRDFGLEGSGRDTLYRATGSTTPTLHPEFGWAAIESLAEGDYLSRPVLMGETPVLVSVPVPAGNRANGYVPLVGRDSDYLDVKIDQDLAWWLGWYAAEGYRVKRGHRVCFSLGGHERSIAECLDDIAFEKFGIRGTIRDLGNKLDYRVSHFALAHLAEYLVGDGAHTKVLAREMLTLPLAEQASFVDGWVGGDGHVEERGIVTLHSVSETLLRQAREILARLGFASNIRCQQDNSGGLASTQNAGPIYRLQWSVGQRRNISQARRDGAYWHKITSVETEVYEGEVWDIEVEGDHSFRAYGMGVHNCSCPWSTYSWGRSGRWKKYEGRMCSHAQAVVYQAQSEEMFGGEISENSQPSGEKWDFPVPMTQPGAWRVAHIPFYDLPPKIATRGFLVRWRDSIHLVTDLLDNMLRLDTGEEVPASEVTHPNYSPTVGLTASLRQDASRSDYGGQHSPPSDGPPLYDLFGESMFPDDVYDHPEYYGWGDALPETVRVIREVRGKPDAMVTIYRSLPPVFYTKYPEIAADAIPQPYTATTFETGDWVAVAKRYAEDHGAGRGWEEWIEPPDRDAPISEWPEQSGWIRVDEDWPVIAAEVPARYIRNGGNDIMEWGYWGPPVAGRVVSGRMGTRLSSKTALADLDGCMVALIPPRSITEALAIEGGEPTEHMHITLAYMGKAADVDLDEVHNAVAEWAGRTPRLAAEVSGFGTFQNGKEPVLWAGFDVPGLERFREDLVDTLCRHGAVPATGHGFVPHMTLKYGPLDEEADLGGGSRQGSLRDHGATGNHEDSLLDQQAYSGSPSTSHQGVRAHVGLGQGGVRGEGGHYPRGDGGPSPVSGGMVYQAGSPSPDDQGHAHRDPSSGAIPGWVSGSRDAVLPSELTGVGRMSRLSAGGHGSVPGQETLIMTGETTMPSSDDNLDPFLFESVIVADGNKWTYYPLSGNPVEPVMAETIEVDAALFEGGTESMLNDEPEPALPSTDGADLAEDGGVTRSAVAVRGTHFVGEGGDPSQGHPAQIADPRAWLMKSSGGGGGRDRQEIAHHAKQFLAKQAVRDFSPAERATIISEGEGQVVARNLDRLSLEGTHYNDMPVSPEDDELLWI